MYETYKNPWPPFFKVYKPLYAHLDLKKNVATRKNTLSGYSS